MLPARLKHLWLTGLGLTLICVVMPEIGHPQPKDDGAVYVLPISTQGISTLEIHQVVGTVSVYGTRKPFAHLVLRRMDKRPFSDLQMMPKIEKTSPTHLTIRSPISSSSGSSLAFKLEVYLPRMHTLIIQGGSLRVRVQGVRQLKTFKLTALQADLDLYQSHVGFDVALERGFVFVSHCQKCKGVFGLNLGRVYVKEGSGQFVLTGKEVNVLSNRFRGSQEITLQSGELRLFRSRGEVKVRGQRPDVYVMESFPDNLDIQLESGNIYLDEKLRISPLLTQKQAGLQTLKGSVQFLVK